MPDVQQLYRSTVEHIGPEPGFPERLRIRRRTRDRRRRAGAYVVAGGVALAIAVGVVQGALDRNPLPTGWRYGTVDGVTVAVPRGWTLVPCEEMEPPQACYGSEVVLFVLSNVGATSTEYPCPRDDPSLAGAVTLFVQKEPNGTFGPSLASWPVDPEAPQRTLDGCVSVRNATWTAADRTFFSGILMAPDASSADMAAVLQAFASMTFGPSTFPTQPPAIATGTTARREWRLVVSGSAEPLSLDLHSGGKSWGFGFGAPTTTDPIGWGSHVFGGRDQSGAVVWGPALEGVKTIRVEGRTEKARILELGPEYDFNAYVLEIEAPGEREIAVILELPGGDTARIVISLSGRSA